jgi:hypothetical protein
MEHSSSTPGQSMSYCMALFTQLYTAIRMCIPSISLHCPVHHPCRFALRDATCPNTFVSTATARGVYTTPYSRSETNALLLASSGSSSLGWSSICDTVRWLESLSLPPGSEDLFLRTNIGSTAGSSPFGDSAQCLFCDGYYWCSLLTTFNF